MEDLLEIRELYGTYLKRRLSGEIDQDELEKELAYITITHTIEYFTPMELPIKPFEVIQFEENKGRMKKVEREEALLNNMEIRNYYFQIEEAKNHNRSNFLHLLGIWKRFSDLQDFTNRGKVETKLMLYNRDNMNLWIKEKDREVLDEWIMMKRSYL